ncbi:MAG: 50S ribosomal protein L25 [Candidatus Cloacimonetes bacterium]|nr:50S ribosomal protein L25 [Candidatus Cloacimonadota bacterium]
MNINIKADVRNKGKKSDLNELRKNGFIPAVIYGEGKEGKLISLEEISFLKEYKKTIGEMTFYDIELDGNSFKTIIKDKQIHPVKRNIRHIDFLELHSGRKVILNIPLTFIGEPIGVKAGGIPETIIRKIEVSCLPKDIVDHIEIDIADLKIGDSIHIKDLDLEEMEAKLPLGATIITILAKRGVEAEDEEDSEEETTIEEEEESNS